MLHVELQEVISAALQKALQRNQPEPQLVANLVKILPDKINSLDPSRYKAGGVFIHAQPKVKYRGLPDKSKKSVELGDLLLVANFIGNKDVSSRRALLLQAKKFRELPVRPDNANQHMLYARWPFFEYLTSTPKLNGQNRRIKGLDLHSAAKYLLIGDKQQCDRGFCRYGRCYFSHCGSSGTCVLTAQPSQPDIGHYRCFASELVDFILGNAGKPFITPPPNKSKNWDKVIEDLTSVTAKQTSVYMGKTSKDELRGRCIPGVLQFIGEFPDGSMLQSQFLEVSGIDQSFSADVDRDEEMQNQNQRGFGIIEITMYNKSPHKL